MELGVQRGQGVVVANPRGSGFRSELERAVRVMVAARWPVFAVVFLGAAAVAAVFGSWLAPFDPNRQNLVLRLADPMAAGPDGSTFWLGSDALGRDVLSRLLYGARVSSRATSVVGSTI
jgi:peptide/nickel transport system permease protein